MYCTVLSYLLCFFYDLASGEGSPSTVSLDFGDFHLCNPFNAAILTPFSPTPPVYLGVLTHNPLDAVTEVSR